MTPTPHTDQFEEIVKKEERLRYEFNEEWASSVFTSSNNNGDKLFLWVLSKLSHIRRETEKGMMEKVQKEIGPDERLPESQCINIESHMLGSCFQCERTKGRNEIRAIIHEYFNDIRG